MIPPGVLAACDRVKPAVSISNPGQGTTQSGTITVSANASDNDQVKQVQFYLDGSPLGGADTVAPFSVSLNTAGLSSGGHSVYAIATDRVGNTQQSATVSWTAANQHAPGGSITSPGYQATVTGTITLAASTSDDVGVTSIQYQIDGSNVGGAVGAGGTQNYDTHYLGVGWHTVYAIIRDAAGNQTTVSSPFYVNNQPPGSSYLSLGPFEYYGWEYCDYYPNFNPNGKAFHPGNGYMPGNPNPTYYNMQGQLWCAHLNDTQDPGTTCFLGLWINSNPGGSPDANYTIGSPGAPAASGWFGMSGGEYVRCERWTNQPDVTPTDEVRVNYRFVPKYSS